MYYHHWAVSQVAHVGYVEFKSGIIYKSYKAISSKMDISELYHVMKLVISSSSEFYVENESKVDEINMESYEPNQISLGGVQIEGA